MIRFWRYFPLVFLLAGCGKGYDDVAPGLKKKMIEMGTGRGMQNGSDYFYLNAHVMSVDDEKFTDASFNPDFIYLAQVKEPSYIADFVQILPQLKKGDSLVFETGADSLFLYYYRVKAPAEVAGKDVHVHVKVVNILTEGEYYERLEVARKESKDRAYEQFEAYLHDRHITDAPVGTGTIKVTKVAGQGETAYYDDVVSIHMVQKTMDGIEVENTHRDGAPYDYVIGGEGGLKGLDEALVKMNKGEKAMVYIPFFLAFGEEGLPPTVLPYANLVVELELLEIRKPY